MMVIADLVVLVSGPFLKQYMMIIADLVVLVSEPV